MKAWAPTLHAETANTTHYFSRPVSIARHDCPELAITRRSRHHPRACSLPDKPIIERAQNMLGREFWEMKPRLL